MHGILIAEFTLSIHLPSASYNAAHLPYTPNRCNWQPNPKGAAVMKITLSIDSKETIELNLADAANLADWLDDVEKYEAIFSRLAEHPSCEVRKAVAHKTCLPQRTLRQLARDPSIEVVRTVASNETALMKFKLSLFEEMIARDVCVAITIAEWLFMVNEEVREELMVILSTHEDPKVKDNVLDFEREQSGDY
jgi:hypothetical protein